MNPPQQASLAGGPAIGTAAVPARSAIPPSFLIAALLALVGIPLYLLSSGALQSKNGRLEDKIRAPDANGMGAMDDEGEDEIAEAKEKDTDDSTALLEFGDLAGLGGLVGFAAIVVLAFAIFPDELNGMINGITTRVETAADSWNQPASSLSAMPTGSIPMPGARSEMYTEKIVTDDQGKTTQYSEHTTTQNAKPESPFAKGGDLLGGRSMIDLMILCKMDPDMCADMGLPFGAKKDTPTPEPAMALEPPVEELYEIVLDEPQSDSEVYLAALRSQPILLLGLSDETLSLRALIVLALATLPCLYAFGELAYQAGQAEDAQKRIDKVNSLEATAKKDIKDKGDKAAIYKADAEKKEAERREIEQIAEANHPTRPWRDAMKDRPWWAGPEWTPPEKPTDLFPENKKYEHDYGGLQDAGIQGKDGKYTKNYGNRHLKLGWLAAEDRTRAERYENERAILTSKWGEDEKSFKGPYRGMRNIFDEMDSKGREGVKKDVFKEMSEAREKKRSVEMRNRTLTQARKKGKEKKGKTIMPALQTKWDEVDKEEEEERYQRTLSFGKPSRRDKEAEEEKRKEYKEVLDRAREEQVRQALQKKKPFWKR